MRVGASELENFLLPLLILTLEPMHSLAVALLQSTILIFYLGGIITLMLGFWNLYLFIKPDPI